jgi:ferredoxin
LRRRAFQITSHHHGRSASTIWNWCSMDMSKKCPFLTYLCISCHIRSRPCPNGTQTRHDQDALKANSRAGSYKHMRIFDFGCAARDYCTPCRACMDWDGSEVSPLSSRTPSCAYSCSGHIIMAYLGVTVCPRYRRASLGRWSNKSHGAYGYKGINKFAGWLLDLASISASAHCTLHMLNIIFRASHERLAALCEPSASAGKSRHPRDPIPYGLSSPRRADLLREMCRSLV